MRLHRFILDLDLSADRLVISDREASNQILNVFRLGEGHRLVVCDGKGTEAMVEIVGNREGVTAVGGVPPDGGTEGKIMVRVVERRVVVTESTARVVLYCAMLKRENFELVVQKATECGVSEIVPVITERTVKLGARLDRLQKIAREAAEQSGRGVVPVLREPMPLAAAILHAKPNAVNILFEPGGPSFGFRHSSLEISSAGLFIGPEGGWDAAEVERLRAEGYHVASLGSRVLRAETAAIVAVFTATGIENGE